MSKLLQKGTLISCISSVCLHEKTDDTDEDPRRLFVSDPQEIGMFLGTGKHRSFGDMRKYWLIARGQVVCTFFRKDRDFLDYWEVINEDPP